MFTLVLTQLRLPTTVTSHEVARVHQVLLDVALGVVQGVAHPAAFSDLAAEIHGALVALVLDVLLRAPEGLVAAVLGALLSAGEGLVILGQDLITSVQQSLVLTFSHATADWMVRT